MQDYSFKYMYVRLCWKYDIRKRVQRSHRYQDGSKCPNGYLYFVSHFGGNIQNSSNKCNQPTIKRVRMLCKLANWHRPCTAWIHLKTLWIKIQIGIDFIKLFQCLCPQTSYQIRTVMNPLLVNKSFNEGYQFAKLSTAIKEIDYVLSRNSIVR
jgi:hypothetical protein